MLIWLTYFLSVSDLNSNLMTKVWLSQSVFKIADSTFWTRKPFSDSTLTIWDWCRILPSLSRIQMRWPASKWCFFWQLTSQRLSDWGIICSVKSKSLLGLGFSPGKSVTNSALGWMKTDKTSFVREPQIKEVCNSWHFLSKSVAICKISQKMMSFK